MKAFKFILSLVALTIILSTSYAQAKDSTCVPNLAKKEVTRAINKTQIQINNNIAETAPWI